MERGGQERREEQGGGGKEHEGDVARDKCAELFRGQLCPLCLGEGNTQRARLTPENFSKIVLFPGGVSFGPSQSGGGNCLQPVSEGSRGKHHPRGAGGKSHTTPHNTTRIPNRPRPHHTTLITETQTLHRPPLHTKSPRTPHEALPQEQHQQKPSYQKHAIFRQDAASFWNAGTPLFQHDPQATTIPGRCILLERGHPFIPK